MALIIRNPTGSNVIIEDLGLELAPSETHDLAIDFAADVQRSANSGDLQTRIIALQIQVLDPLDDATPLSTAGGANSPAIQCVRAHNDPHYRIKGGEMDQLDDVEYAGSPVPNNPNSNDILQWNGSLWTTIQANSITGIDHGTLSGLSDDDHPQYVLDAGDTMTGTLFITSVGGSPKSELRVADPNDSSKYIRITWDSPTGAPAIDRESGSLSGTMILMPQAVNPQWIFGSNAAGTANVFIDADNDADLRLNTLHVGPVYSGPGGIRPSTTGVDIGKAGEAWATIHLDDEIRFYEVLSGSPRNYVSFQAPTSIASNVTWTLPNTDSTGTQALVSDGAGTLSWQTISAGGFGSPITGIGDVDRVQHIHVGKHGNDSNDGLTPDKAKLTFTSAIAAAVTGSPATVRYTIWCEDAGTYVESFTIPPFVSIEAEDATINGTVTVNDDTEFTIREVTAAVNTSAVVKSSGTGSARVNAEILRTTGTGDTIVTQAGETGVLLVYCRQLFSENGSGVVDNSVAPTGHIHIEIEDLYITGTGSGLDRNSSTGLIVGRVAHILEIGGGIGNGTGISISSGRVDVNVAFLNCTTSFNVSAAGTLKMLVNEITGTRVQTSGLATVDVIEANAFRWITLEAVAGSPVSTFLAKRIGFVSIDTTAAPAVLQLPFPPSDGDNVSIQDGRGTFGTNNLVVDGNGAFINTGAGSPQSFSEITIDVSGTSGIFIYNAALGAWTFTRIQEEVAFSPTNLIYVTKNGNDVTGTGSFSNPFLTVKRGIQEALSRVVGSPSVPTTVKVLDGVYVEENPLVISGPGSENVNIQGESENSVFIEPANDGNLFELTSNVAGNGPSLNRLFLQGNAAYKSPTGSPLPNNALVYASGDGRFFLDKLNARDSRKAFDAGNGTITTLQEFVHAFGTVFTSGIGAEVKGDNTKYVGQVTFFRDNDIAVDVRDDARLELGNYEIAGSETGQSGIGIVLSDTANVFTNSGYIRNLVTGLSANDNSVATIVSAFFTENTNDFNQVDGTAQVIIQGVLSRTNHIITDGSIVSLNYIDSESADFIVGNADIQKAGSPEQTDPGLQFRVRDFDGRVFIGDQAENFNAATNTVGGSRTINLVDTNGNMRIWRWASADGQDPSLEWVKGINPAIEDGEGDSPIVSITAATDTIVIDVSGVDYNDPLDPTTPGLDRRTLAGRAFAPGKEIRINGTASNNADYVVSSATYTGGSPEPQTIAIVVTADITVSEGAGGEVVWGGGAGRPDGVSTYVGDPGAAVAAGTGDVHWDMFLQEDDYFVIRQRTGGGGGVPDEKVRIYSDHSEWLGATLYGNSDNSEILVIQAVAGADSYVEIRNADNTGLTGPELAVISAGTNADLELIPKGTGTVKVPAGYEANILDDSLITKAYFDAQVATPPIVQARRTTTFAIPVTPSWGDVTFDVTDVETDPTVVEHNNTNTELFDIKADGMYEMSYVLTADDEVTGRLVAGGQSPEVVIPGSTHLTGDTGDVNDVIVQNSPTVYYEFTAGQTVRVQVQAQTAAEVLQTQAHFTIKRIQGIRGEKGEPGTGATIEVEENDISVVMNASTVNFEGNGVTVTAEGGSPVDKATVTINRDFLHRHNGATTQTLTGTPVTMLFGSTIRNDANYSYSAGEVTITNAGWYRITFDISADDTTGTRSIGRFFLENNTVLVPGSYAFTYNRNTTAGENTGSATVLIDASVSDVIRVRGQSFAGGNIVTIADACRLTIESLGS